MNCGPTSPDQLLPSCLANLNWDQSMHPLTSIVPSAIFGEMSSFKGSPLSSMHANRLMPFSTDPGFAERAAKYSCFSSGNCEAFSVQLDIPEAGKLSPNSSSHSLKAKESPAQNRAQSEMGNGEFASREDSSVTDQASAPGEISTKKRKPAPPRRKVKVAEESDLIAKKCRTSETPGIEKDGGMPKEDQNAEEKHGKDNCSKAPEPYKDYIHVRARRGQATDSHSLAERVRREKISQRMKLLQDLVPGCNKITGKALMLDEIINYVQSLQRQVEFLSMKLATVNPRLDFSLENLISKESLFNQASICFANSLYPLENLAAAIPFGHQSKDPNLHPFTVPNEIGLLDSAIHQAAILQSSLDAFEGSSSQVEGLWDDELHGVLQTSPWPNQEIGVTFQSFHGQLPTAHMKIEH